MWGAGKANLHARDCGHPPTLLTEGHALDALSKRKMCPFPRWISAHLCPKTVPHAFLCMWTWQSSANHQQDVIFVFPMWWAIPTFTHFPCKNRTSPWLVRIRDVAVAKEKFSSVEVNPWVAWTLNLEPEALYFKGRALKSALKEMAFSEQESNSFLSKHSVLVLYFSHLGFTKWKRTQWQESNKNSKSCCVHKVLGLLYNRQFCTQL